MPHQELTGFTLSCEGRTIFRRDGKLVTDDGTLAGADLCLMGAVRTATKLLGLTPAQALSMASAVPAAFLGLERELGSIARGCWADMLLLTPEMEVAGTWLRGGWQGEAVPAQKSSLP